MRKGLRVDLPSGPGAVLSLPSSPVDFLLLACCMQEEEETDLGLPGAVQYQLFCPGFASLWKYDSPAPLH
jgi:hypothetical protein